MTGVSRDYYAGRQRGLAEGREQEKERIIKLLEPLAICADDCDHYDCGTWGYQHAIALIKGEN